MKYIDDLTLSESIDLKKKLTINTSPGPRPLTYHERTQHILKPEDSLMQEQLNLLCQYAEEHSMKINFKKTKCMLFNNKRSLDFMPQLHTPPGEVLEVVERIRLLGV